MALPSGLRRRFGWLCCLHLQGEDHDIHLNWRENFKSRKWESRLKSSVQ